MPRHAAYYAFRHARFRLMSFTLPPCHVDATLTRFAFSRLRCFFYDLLRHDATRPCRHVADYAMLRHAATMRAYARSAAGAGAGSASVKKNFFMMLMVSLFFLLFAAFARHADYAHADYATIFRLFFADAATLSSPVRRQPPLFLRCCDTPVVSLRCYAKMRAVVYERV